MKLYKLESCVDSIEKALKSEENGADQIELCGRLDLDGINPPIDLIEKCLKELKIPVKVMLRPRGGSFEYDVEDISQIIKQIELYKSMGVQKLIFGAIKEGSLDTELIKVVIEKAYPISVSIHKAIDTSAQILSDLEEIVSWNTVESVLSSGGELTAALGQHNLLKMRDICSDNLELIAAGKITQDNLDALHGYLNLGWYHGQNIL